MNEAQSQASMQARKLNLVSDGHGGWLDSRGKFVATTEDGKLKFVVNKLSVPYINGMTLDWQKEGLNEIFKFINPKEKDSCGCGVSINFDLEQVEIDKNKISEIFKNFKI